MADPSVRRQENWLDRLRADMAKRAATDARRSSLLRLAKSALDLHATSLAFDMPARNRDGGSAPLALAVSALRAALKNEGSFPP